MNRKWYTLPALICILILIAGCGKKGDVTASPSDASAAAVSTAPTGAIPTEPVAETQEATGTGVISEGENTTSEERDPLEITGANKLRVAYTGNRSSVTYITSASGLPDYSELAQYDDAFFAEHALVLVTETVGSGSIDVGIQSVNISGSNAEVTLYHEGAQPGTYNTNDMATWLLWTEVEPGLDCRWTVVNPALTPDNAAY